MIEEYGSVESSRIVGRVVLEPDPVQLEARAAAPAEAFERRARGILREHAARPGSVRESLAQVAHLDAIEPDRVLAVERRRRVIELDHVLDAGPLAGPGVDTGIVEEKVPPMGAARIRPHAHPVVVVVEPGRECVLFCTGDEPVVANGLDPRLRVRPGERRVVAAHPDAGVVVLAVHRILDVVADVEHVIDAGAQLLEEVSAVVGAAAGPRDVERARAGASGRNVGGQRHRRTVEGIGPSDEEIR